MKKNHEIKGEKRVRKSHHPYRAFSFAIMISVATSPRPDLITRV
jgi:hypothetical protein